MRDASPPFQPERGDGGFQLAQHAGFQTQTPVWTGTLGLVAGLDSPTAFRTIHPAVTGDLAAAVGLLAQTYASGARRYVGELLAAVGLDAQTSTTGARARRYVGDLRVVVGLDAATTGPSRPVGPGIGVLYIQPVRWRVVGDLAVVVGLTSRSRLTRRRAPRARPEPRRHAVVGDLARRPAAWSSRTRGLDYVRDIVLPDDEEVLQLLLGGGRWLPNDDEDAVLLVLGGRE